MGYHRRDRWETPSPDITSIASNIFDNMREREINQLNYCEHYPVSDNPDDTTVIVIYDGLRFDHEGEKPKDHPPEIYCRVMKYADSICENKARQIYFIPFEAVEDEDQNFKIVCERINSVIDSLDERDGPYSVLNVSRKCLRYVQPPKRYQPLDTLRVINRLENFKYGREVFEGVVSIPDRDVFKRNDFGKIGKENQTVIGEWVYATFAALDGNKYDIDAKGYTYEIIRTEKQWTKAFEDILNAQVLAIDTETKNLNRIANRLACIQLTCDGSHAYIIPFDHPDITLPIKLMQRIKDDLTDYFEYEKSKYHIYANAKFDLIQIIRELKLRWYNHDVADVQGAAQMLDENRKFRSNVKYIIQKDPRDVIPGFALEQLIIERGCSAYLQTSMGKADRANIFATPFEMVAEYGGLDAVLTWRLLYSQLEEANDRGDNYDRFMAILTGQINSMIRAFVRMELTGLPIDRAYLAREQSKTDGVFEKARQQARQELYMLDSVHEANSILLRGEFGTEEDLFGKNDNWIFDIDKTEHQQVLFFDVLGLEPLKVGKNGLPSVDKAFKEYYAPKSDDGKYLETSVEEVELFAQYGELKQLFNSFMKAFYKKLFTSEDMRVDGRLRPSFKYLTIVTGRTGASDPSLQNVPQRSKMAKPVKRQFITKPGSIYVKADFSSHETRNWGIASGEDRLAESYIKGMTERNKFRIKDVTTPEEWEQFSKHMKQFDLHVINCLAGDTMVSSSRGVLRMDDPRLEGSTVMTLNGPAKVAKHLYMGTKKTIKLKMANGKELACTTDHRVKVFNQGQFIWKTAGSLKVGDYLMAIAQEQPQPKQLLFKLKDYPEMTGRGTRTTFISKRIEMMTPDLAYLMGVILSEGSIDISKHYKFGAGKCSGTYVAIGSTDLDLLGKCQRIFHDVFGYDAKILSRNNKSGHKINGVEVKSVKPFYKIAVGSNDIVYKLEQMGLFKDKGATISSHNIYAPWSILEADAESKLAFVAGYLDGDGSVGGNATVIDTSSPAMFRDLGSILDSLNISYTNRCTYSRSGRTLNRIYLKDNVTRLNKYAFKQSVEIYGNKVPTDYWRDLLQPVGYRTKANPTVRAIPTEKTRGWLAGGKKVFRDDKGNIFTADGSINYFDVCDSVVVDGKYDYTNLEGLLKRVSKSGYDKWKDIRDKRQHCIEITGIEDGPVQKVYDLSIEAGKSPSFIANGVVVHNCGLFYGLTPEEVTKAIRSKVKTTAFGVLYGMAAPRLAATLKISEEEAQQLIDTLFEKFPDGSAYITITHKQAQTYLVCVSGIGRVRHMWGYLHTDRGVQGGMDRRGPNSMIQGISSEEGMEANYQLQWHMWHLFHKQDLPLEIEICNTVHDSTENISPIVHAPIAAYLIEHCGTTHIHRRFRKRYGLEFNVGLEMEFEFGPSLGEMHDWNYRPEQLEKIVMKSQEWAHANLGHPMQTEKQMKAFRHNNDLLFKLRQEELMEMPRNGVGELMILDKHIARELAF